MDKIPLYVALARLVGAYKRCEADPQKREWKRKHEDRIEFLTKNHLPHGSGFDVGTTIDLDASTDEKLVLLTSYHHMNEGGCYDGWTKHRMIVRPSLAHGFSLSVGCRDRNQIKEYIGETVRLALSEPVFEYEPPAEADKPPA